MSDTQSGDSSDRRSPPQFPVGTLVYYGPDDKTVTKIVAGVFLEKDGDPLRKNWVGDGVTTNPQVIAELGRFFKDYGVTRVVMTKGIVGCPHEAGIDYPLGEECPFCPFWRGKQGDKSTK